MDLKDKSVLLYSKEDYDTICNFIEKYGGKIAHNEKEVDYLILVNVPKSKIDIGNIKYTVLVEVADNKISYYGINPSGQVSIFGSYDRYVVFRRPHERGYKYVAPFSAPIDLYIPRYSGSFARKSFLVWLAHAFSPLFKRMMPAEIRIYGKQKNPIEEKIGKVVWSKFKSKYFDYSIIGDTKRDDKSRIVCIVSVGNRKYITKFPRWGYSGNLNSEYKKLSRLISLGVTNQKAIYSDNPTCLIIEYVEGNNLLDEFAITRDIKLLKRAILEVAKFHKKSARVGVPVSHGDLGAVNFIVSKKGEIQIIDWESAKFTRDQKSDKEKAINALSILYHKVMGEQCCFDNKHSFISNMLTEAYNDFFKKADF
ncbi:MAG: hypothetical protein QW500_00270 [Candidatus Micrarchaeia archaeon]